MQGFACEERVSFTEGRSETITKERQSIETNENDQQFLNIFLY